MARSNRLHSVLTECGRVGPDRATISRLENGQIDNPTIATMTRYARALGKKVLVSLVEAGRE